MKLVVNGCSYVWNYAQGNGHNDLANRLGIAESESIAKLGSSNNRIIRTTLKHSYQTTEPCFYIIGLTFADREEQPIGKIQTEFEGRWLSIQNGFLDQHFDGHWTQADCDRYMEIKTKIALTDNRSDKLEDLMYRVLSMINDLISRGHQVLVFQQVNDHYDQCKSNAKLDHFNNSPYIINGLGWYAIPWQISQGARTQDDDRIPVDIRHIHCDDYIYLNNFLENYIRKNDVYLSVL